MATYFGQNAHAKAISKACRVNPTASQGARGLHRTRLATIPLDDGSDLVVSLDAHGDLDLRRWTPTGDLQFPSKNGVTVPRHVLRDLIDALRNAKRRGAA